MEHKFKYTKGNNQWGNKNGGCLERYFNSTTILGTVFSNELFLQQYAKWKPFVKDMKKMGFILYIKREDSKNVFVYAKREDYPSDSAYSVAVCIQRYMFGSNRHHDKWLKNYLTLRKFYGVTKSVFLADVVSPGIYKRFTSTCTASRPRDILKKDVKRRQSGDSVFQERAGFKEGVNYEYLRPRLKLFFSNPSIKTKKQVDKWL